MLYRAGEVEPFASRGPLWFHLAKDGFRYIIMDLKQVIETVRIDWTRKTNVGSLNRKIFDPNPEQTKALYWHYFYIAK